MEYQGKESLVAKTKFNILILVENAQEYDEILCLLKNINLNKKNSYILCKTNTIYNISDYYHQKNNTIKFKETISLKNPFNSNFKTQIIFKKILVLIINFFILFRVIQKYKIRYFITGVPLIFSRLLKLFNLKLIRISYIRGLLFDSSKSTSTSDQLYFVSNKFKFFNKIKFINNYYSEFILTTGKLNKKFLIERGIPHKNIYLCGPILLDEIPTKINGEDSTGIKNLEVIFITQAFSWHLDNKADSEQKTFLNNLIEQVNKLIRKDIILTIRLHPRDSIENYEKIIQKANIKIHFDTSEVNRFLSNLTKNKIIISGLSTLAFEWMYLGGKCYFYTTNYFKKNSKTIYNKLKIRPYENEKDLLDAILKNQKIDHYNINEIFYKNDDTQNVKTASKIVENIINI